MPKYFTRPVSQKPRAYVDDGDFYPEGETYGHEVIVADDTASEDAPTGLLTASGDMIWRNGHRVGFALGGDE